MRKSISLLLIFTMILSLALPMKTSAITDGEISGVFYLSSGLDNTYCMDVINGADTNYANIQLFKNVEGDNQKWRIEKRGDYYSIINVLSEKALTIQSTTPKDGSNICQQTYSGKDTQLWNITEKEGKYSITSKSDGTLALNINTETAKNKKNIELKTMQESDAQKWILNEAPVYINEDLSSLETQITELERKLFIYPEEKEDIEGEYFIVSKLDASYSIDVANSSTSNYGNVQLFKKLNATNQIWEISPVDDYFKIINKNSGKALTIQATAPKDGSNVCQQTYSAKDNQLWIIEKQENGYKFKSKLDPTLAININSETAKNKKNIEMGLQGEGLSQSWVLSKTGITAEYKQSLEERLALLQQSFDDNMQSYDNLVYDLMIIDGVATDLVTGTKYPKIGVEDGYIKGGTVTLPKSYTDFTIEMIVDYNESSTAGLMNNMAYRNGKGTYEGTETNSFRLEEIPNAKNRGKLRFPYATDQYNRGNNVTIGVQVFKCPVSSRELLPQGDQYWCFSIDSTNLVANLRIDGATAVINEDTSKVLKQSFALNGNHKIRELRIYGSPLSTDEMLAHYNLTGIAETVPTEMGEHTYDEWVVTREPTYIRLGEEQATCLVCGQVTTKSIPMLQSENIEDHLAAHYVVKDGVVTDLISGTQYANIPVTEDGYFGGGTVKFPQSYSNFTLDFVVDYNEQSTNGIVKEIYFTDNKGKYDGTNNVFRLQECLDTSGRGSIRVPWAPNSYNSVNISVPVQIDAHVSSNYEYLPNGDLFWSFSMNSDELTMLSRINGGTGTTTMTSSKVLPASIYLNADHKIKELRVYSKPMTAEQQKARYETYDIEVPTSAINVPSNGLTDLGTGFLFERTTGKNPVVLESQKEAGTYTVTDAKGNPHTYTISDYVHPDLGIDNSKFDALYIINELPEIWVGKQYALAARPVPFGFNEEGKASKFDVTWTTSDSSICNVIDGLLIPKKTGTVTITATLTGTNMSDSITINVTNMPVDEDIVWNVPYSWTSDKGDTFSDTDYSMTTRAIYAAIDYAAANGYTHIVFPKREFKCIPITTDGTYAKTYFIPSHMTVEFPEGSIFHLMDSKWCRSPYTDEAKAMSPEERIQKVNTGGQYIFFKFAVPNNEYEKKIENSKLIIDKFYGERYQSEAGEGIWLEESRFVEMGRRAINCSVEIKYAEGTVGYFITVDGTHTRTTKGAGLITYGNLEHGRLNDDGTIREDANWISTPNVIEVLKNGSNSFYIGKYGTSYDSPYWNGSTARIYDIQWYDANMNIISTERGKGTMESYSKPSNAKYFKISLQQPNIPSGEAENNWIAMQDDGAAKYCEIKNVYIVNHGEGAFSAVGESDYLWVHGCFTMTNSKVDSRTGDVEDGWLRSRYTVINNNFLNGYFGTPSGFGTFAHTNYFKYYNLFSGEGEMQRVLNNTIDTIVIADKVNAHVFYNVVQGINTTHNSNYLGHIFKANNLTGKWVRSY